MKQCVDPTFTPCGTLHAFDEKCKLVQIPQVTVVKERTDATVDFTTVDGDQHIANFTSNKARCEFIKQSNALGLVTLC